MCHRVPHGLSQQVMGFYSNYVIQGRTIFPGAGCIDIGIEDGVELLDMKFLHPFDLEVGCRMVCNHHYGGGMEFHSQSPEGDTLMVASIASVNAGLSALTMESHPTSIMMITNYPATNLKIKWMDEFHIQ